MTQRPTKLVVAVVIVVAVIVAWRACRTDRVQTITPASRVVEPGSVRATPATSAVEPVGSEASPASGALRGSVRDDAAAPIAQAIVCAYKDGWQSAETPPHEPICAPSDDQGRYQLSGLPATTYRLGATAPRFLPAAFRPANSSEAIVALAAGEQRDGIDIVLRGGAVEITGIVRDEAGGPIAHAKVAARVGTRHSFLSVWEVDPVGQFSLWVEPGRKHIYVSADGYAEAEVETMAPGAIEVRLAPEASITGIVVDGATHQPIVGARVTAENQSMDAMIADLTGTSDAEGRFRVAPLGKGRYLMTARRERGYGRAEDATRVEVGEHAGGVTIKLLPAYRVTGAMKIVPSGAPCPRGYMWLRTEGQHNSISLTRTADGQYTADDVPPGTYSVELRCLGYRPRGGYPPVVIRHADVAGLVWEIDAGATLRGRVLTSTGAPVADALVSTTFSGDMHISRDASKPDGTFKLTGLPPGSQRITVETTRGVAPRGGFVVELADGGDHQRDLVLEPSGAVHGTVVDVDQKPVSGVEIIATALPFSLENMRSELATTDARGSFVISELSAGDYRVAVAPSGMGPVTPSTAAGLRREQVVTVRAGEAASAALVVAAREARPADDRAAAEKSLVTVTGRFVEQDGKKPISGLYVMAQPINAGAGPGSSPERGKQAMTDRAGRFTIDDVPVGRALISGTLGMAGKQTHTPFIVMRTIQGTGTVDLGDIAVPRQRVRPGDPVGVLGLAFEPRPAGAPGSSLFEMTYKINSIDPDGPAVTSGLQVGDIITSCDGVNVTGDNAMLWHALTQAPPGTRLVLGTQRGTTASIVLAAP